MLKNINFYLPFILGIVYLCMCRFAQQIKAELFKGIGLLSLIIAYNQLPSRAV
jgi:hypothetical protein